MKKCILVLLPFLVFPASAQSPDKLTGPYLGQKLPGTTPEIFAPGIVASQHASVTISRDGKEIYWSVGRIYVTTCKNGLWTKPEAVPFTRNEGGDGPKLSPDEQIAGSSPLAGSDDHTRRASARLLGLKA